MNPTKVKITPFTKGDEKLFKVVEKKLYGNIFKRNKKMILNFEQLKEYLIYRYGVKACKAFLEDYRDL